MTACIVCDLTCPSDELRIQNIVKPGLEPR